MKQSALESLEYRSFSDSARADRQVVSHITGENMKPIKLTPQELASRRVPGSVSEQDVHVLHLVDRS